MKFTKLIGSALKWGTAMAVFGAWSCTLAAEAEVYAFSTFAGSNGTRGSTDATGTAAQFSGPWGVAADASGNVYVADTGNHTIRKISATGVVTTLAGAAGQSGSADGSGSVARFYAPKGLSVDGSGNVYVADTGNSTIRKITAAGVVTTLAGTPAGAYGGGWADGVGAAAGFYKPMGVTVDASGNVYVADTGNNTIRKIAADGTVTTIAGDHSAYFSSQDGTGTGAHFYGPSSIALTSDGNLLVVDAVNSAVRKVTPQGVVTTVTSASSLPGLSSSAACGIACDTLGNAYIVIGSVIMRMAADGSIVALAGSPGVQVSADGTGAAAGFNGAFGLACGASGAIYVAEFNSHTIRRGVSAGSLLVWNTPAAITVGTALSATQLNAQSSMPGQFFYTPALGTVLSSGVQTLSVVFVPSSWVGVSFVTKEVSLTVTAGPVQTPRIEWGPLAAIDHGTFLTSAQLNAKAYSPTTGAQLSGTYDYTPLPYTLLTPGTYTLSVRFTPGEANYASVTATTELVVRAVESTPLVVTTQPMAATVQSGGSATFTCVVSGTPAAKYYWAESRDGGNVWQTLADSDQYSGTTTSSLTITRVTAGMDGYRYFCCAYNYVSTGTQTNVVQLSVQDYIAYTGGYFGTFASGGTWALYVGAPSRFVAYLPWRHSAIVEELTVEADGTFSVTCQEHVAAGAATSAATLTLTGAITAPNASQRPVSAKLTELGETLTGSFATSGTYTNFSGDFYTASALGVDEGTLYLIAGYGGDLQAIVISPTLVDGARGTITATGSQTMTTAEGRQLAITIDPTARTLQGTLSETVTGQAAVQPGGEVHASAVKTLLQFAGLAQSVVSTSRAVNIATRAYCGKDNAVTIGGFVVAGSAKKRVLVRAVGPSLTKQGLSASEVLADPTIEVHDYSHGNTTLTTNDNWGDNTNAAEITATAKTVGASELLASDTASAGALLELDPGIYTFVVKGKNDTSGIVLLEVYDADATSTGTTFTNIATRAYATTGNGVAIGGFVVNGNAPKRVLLRALGPTLTTQGLNVSEVLTNPVIELHDALNANAKIAENDDWGTNTNAASITTTAARIGATPIDQSDTKSAALLLNLQPGVYTFIASGNATAPSGIVLVEVYDAD